MKHLQGQKKTAKKRNMVGSPEEIGGGYGTHEKEGALGTDLDKDVGRSPKEMARHLGSLWFLVKVSTSFMNRRQSSSSHGKAMHCTATGSPTDPSTACSERVSVNQSLLSTHKPLAHPSSPPVGMH